MDIVWTLLTLPYAPARLVTGVVKVVAQQAEAQQRDPIAIRRELEELDRAAAAGEIDPQERDEAQQRVLERLTLPASEPKPTAPPAAVPRRPGSAGARATGRRGTPGRRR